MVRRNTSHPAQSGFDTFEPPHPTDRLFFAVHPDAATAAVIADLAADLRERHGLHGMPLPGARLHVTLHHLGDFAGLPADLVAAARGAADGLEVAPFDVGFDRAASFASSRGKRPFVLQGGEELDGIVALHRGLLEALARRGVGIAGTEAFTPHVTLLYDEAVVAPVRIEPIRWRVGSFALVHSLLGRSRHVELARWLLRD